MTLYVDYIPKMMRNGYQAIPVSPSGIPLVEGYLTERFTQQDALSWRDRYQGAYIALACGPYDVYSLDFDVNDEGVSDKCMTLMHKQFPDAMIRTCNPNRFACVFRAHESLLGYSNGHSEQFTVQGELSQIELIGNRPITIAGRHRKTKKLYRWGNISNPSKTRVDQLPELTHRDIEKIFNFFNRHMISTYKIKNNRSYSLRDDGVDSDSDGMDRDETGMPTVAELPKSFPEKDVQMYMEYFTGDTYIEWRNMGMALHVQYNGAREGLELWDTWSKEFDGYVSYSDCETKWNSFKNNKSRPFTFASYRYIYKKENADKIASDQVIPRPQDLQEFEDRFVMIQKGSLVADLAMPPYESLLKVSEWSYAYSNVTTLVPVGDKMKNADVTKLWLKSSARLSCYNTMYYPGGDRVIRSEDKGSKQQYYNIYNPPFVSPTPERDKIQLFLDHLAYILPDEGDVDWMVNWMAQLVQNPEARYRVAPLSISTYHGTGRGWLGKVLMLLAGQSNASTIKEIGVLVSPNAKTGFLNNTTICLVNETYVKKQERYQIDNRLRNILGDSFQHIDIKYGEETSKNIFTRFFFQSNHIDAMILDEKDARIEVFINNKPPKNKEYYQELYGLLEPDSDFMDQLACYLRDDIQVNTQWLQDSRKTKARDTLIRAGKSPTGVGFFEFKQMIGDKLFTEEMLSDFMAEYQAVHQTDTTHINTKELDFLINKQIQFRKTLRSKKGNILKVCSFSYNELDNVIPSIRQSKRTIELYFKSINDNGE